MIAIRMKPGVGACQDPCQGGSGAGDRGDDTLVSLPPKDTPGSPTGSPSELGSPGPRQVATFDLLNMGMLILDLGYGAVLQARLLLQSCSNEPSLGWFSVCVLGVSAPAAMGYLQDRCGGGASEAEQQKRRRHAVHRKDLQNVQLTRQDAMMEVKDLFYGGMLAVLMLLYFVPVGWVLACLTTALFLWNRDFCRVVLDLREVFQSGQNPSSEGQTDHTEPDHGSLDRTPTPTSLEV
ncbi:unnamed protein product [Coregonus sp. 'balchen']|nr:unnamed protein product [Coregonus sp. 'balchen']